MADDPMPRMNARLQALVGVWKTRGFTKATDSEPELEVDATDTYEWLPSRSALLHKVDARVGDHKVLGEEIIGYDSEAGHYTTKYFGNDGPNNYEADLSDNAGSLVWSMRSKKDRFTGTFSGNGNVINGHWELLSDGGNWQPWMDITLTKERG